MTSQIIKKVEVSYLMNVGHTKFYQNTIGCLEKNVKKTSFGLHKLSGVARVGLEWIRVGESGWEHGLVKSDNN